MVLKAKTVGLPVDRARPISASPEEKLLGAIFGEKQTGPAADVGSDIAARRKAAALASLDRNREALALLSKA